MQLWAELREGIADLFLPLTCVVCGDLLGARAATVVCAPCWARVRPLREPRCERCGHPTPVLELTESALSARGVDVPVTCTWCELLPPYVRAVRSVCWATLGVGGEIVHALKYDGWTRVADELAARMARVDWPVDVLEERDALVPVPLAPVRLRERGFNQSELLARAVGNRLGLNVVDALVRTRSTVTQTRLAPDARAANVSGAFALAPGADVRGMHLVLVDDVATTCATLNACAAALFSAGARLISYLTFARAPAAADRPAPPR